jgi:hypothetical protein
LAAFFEHHHPIFVFFDFLDEITPQDFFHQENADDFRSEILLIHVFIIIIGLLQQLSIFLLKNVRNVFVFLELDVFVDSGLVALFTVIDHVELNCARCQLTDSQRRNHQ